jgi:transcriptional regulator with XRE-family HTH domain
MDDQSYDEMSLPEQVHNMRDRLARNLVAARAAIGASQDQVAIAAGVSRTTLNQLENAEGDPRLSTLIGLASAFGVSPVFLLLGSEEIMAIGESQNSPEAQQVKEELSDEDLGTMRRLLASGVPKNRSKALAMIAGSVGKGWGQGILAGAAIGTALMPGVGTAIGAGLAGMLQSRKNKKGRE